MDITNMWNSNDEQLWKNALKEYWEFVKPENLALEKKMDSLDLYMVKGMSVFEFYEFLENEYFVWKYTAPNRLATTRRQLCRYQLENKLYELESIQRELFIFNLNDAIRGLSILSRIHGLGTAGASGLLALLFPGYFGTVDQFVVKALSTVDNLPQIGKVKQMNPDGIGIKDAALVIEIMRQKAKNLNSVNQTSYWTPRKIDMVFWACRT